MLIKKSLGKKGVSKKKIYFMQGSSRNTEYMTTKMNENAIEETEATSFDEIVKIVKEKNTGYLGVRNDRLVGLLIEGIKEQQEQIDDLRQQIKEIKNGSP